MAKLQTGYSVISLRQLLICNFRIHTDKCVTQQRLPADCVTSPFAALRDGVRSGGPPFKAAVVGAPPPRGFAREGAAVPSAAPSAAHAHRMPCCLFGLPPKRTPSPPLPVRAHIRRPRPAIVAADDVRTLRAEADVPVFRDARNAPRQTGRRAGRGEWREGPENWHAA